MGPLSKIFRFFTLYVHSVSHTVPQNITTSVNQSPISISFTRETGVLCLYFPLLTVVQKFSSDQLLSLVRLFVTPWTAARQASLSITSSWSSPKPMSIESVNPSDHLILCHPLLFPPSVFTSIRIFFNESVLGIRWQKYWSFSFNISPPKNTQDWSPSGWTGWISLQSKGLSRVFSNTTVQKHQFVGTQLSL